MENSIQGMKRWVRRRLRRVVQKSPDRNHVRRALAILHLREGLSVSAVAERLCAARSSVQYWKYLYETEGESGLVPARRGRRESTVNEAVVSCVRQLLESTPRAHGYLRSRWSSELLAQALKRQLGIAIHASTVRRLLPRLGFGWRRARPTLYKRDHYKQQKLQAIDRALARRRTDTAVFYVDEADVDLNPRIGFGWRRRGHQEAVPTPGQNEKRYLAGALHAHTGKLVWVEGPSKNSALFLRLLEALRRSYRCLQRIVVILDNYRIHKSRRVLEWLQENPKFQLLFQPAYHPWVNRIERLWKALHDTVTRNHRYPNMKGLMAGVRRFMDVVQPFPGAGHALATL